MSVLTPPPYPSLVEAVRVALGAASHLEPVDHAAAQALFELARRVDERVKGDNVSLPTFVRLCEALRLTPAARQVLVRPAGPAGVATGGDGGDEGSERGGGDGGAATSLAAKRRELRDRVGKASAR